MSLTAALEAPLAIAPPSKFPPSETTFWQPWIVFGEVDLFGWEVTLAITRPMVVLAVIAVLLAVWLNATTKKAAVVPSKGQWMTEQVHGLVRNNVARDMIGSRDYLPYVPFLFSLFVIILFNNWAGIIPPINLPTFGRFGMVIALVLVVYVVYHAIGIRKHGLGGYFKSMIPGGLPVAVVPAVFLIELMTYFITRPLTLSLRLFGTMFAGHMLVLVSTLGAWELFQSGGFLTALAFPTWIGAFGVFAFEALIQGIQAYVFILLTASYIGAAVADEH